MSNQLTVVLVLRKGGDFSFKDVKLLSFHIRKNWEGDLRIICLNDSVTQIFKLADGLELHPMPNLWKGWWSKMNMFAPEMEQYRPFLYMDLDTAIVGSLNAIFPLKDPNLYITLENVYYPGRIGSGLMWIPAGNDKITKIWNTWIQDVPKHSKIGGGDQMFIERTVKIDKYFGKDKISSFKPAPRQHWLLNLDKKLSIVYFHGYPRIPQASARTPWVREYLKCKAEVVTEGLSSTKIQRAFVINLDERKDRLAQFMNQHFPFKVERFPAIKMNPGILGCNASHKALLQQEISFPFAVFEDDAQLVSDWHNVETAMEQLPKGWDILFVGANLNKPLVRYSKNLFRLKDAWTTHAMIYGSQGVVDYIVEKMPSDTTPIDVFFSEYVQTNFNCFIVDPIVAVQRGSYSDVNKGVRDYAKLMETNFKKNTVMIKPDYKKWFDDKGDTTHRLNYPLTKNSVVFDVGGYKGDFTQQINDKYGCKIYCFEPVLEYFSALQKRFINNPNIAIFPYAISNANKKSLIYLDDDGSGMYTKKGKGVEIQCHTLDYILKELGIEFIDLLKLNIEGSEYDLLMYMVQKNLISICGDIQVQFHTFIPDFQNKYEELKEWISRTHCITYQYPFIWENWKNMIGSYSQTGQDKFAISQFPKDYVGTFLDIGCNLPTKINNTYLLEQLGWDGTSFDICDFSKEWKVRSSRFVQEDVLKCDYNKYDIPKLVDYLTLDIEGDGQRFQALKRLIVDFGFGFEFKVITIEHDAYRGFNKSERLPQRKLLTEMGYTLVMPDLHHNACAFEDWWINPKYIK